MFPKKPGMRPPMKDELSAPGPLESKADIPMEKPEPPEVEAGEEYGSKLMSDLESAGESHGLDPATTRKVAASFFEAMAKCLAGEKDPVENYDAGGETFELEGE